MADDRIALVASLGDQKLRESFECVICVELKFVAFTQIRFILKKDDVSAFINREDKSGI